MADPQPSAPATSSTWHRDTMSTALLCTTHQGAACPCWGNAAAKCHCRWLYGRGVVVLVCRCGDCVCLHGSLCKGQGVCHTLHGGNVSATGRSFNPAASISCPAVRVERARCCEHTNYNQISVQNWLGPGHCCFLASCSACCLHACVLPPAGSSSASSSSSWRPRPRCATLPSPRGPPPACPPAATAHQPQHMLQGRTLPAAPAHSCWATSAQASLSMLSWPTPQRPLQAAAPMAVMWPPRPSSPQTPARL